MSYRGGQICRADAEQFLPWVENIPGFGGEGAGSGHTFDVGKQKTSGSQRNYSLNIAQSECRPRQTGQPRRDFSCYGHPKCGKTEQSCNHNRQRDNAQGNRPARQQTLAEHKHRDGNETDCENNEVRLPQLPGKQYRPLKEVMTAARHAEQGRQLSHGDSKSGTSLETYKNAVADQFYEHAQPKKPSEQAEPCHREGREAGDLRITLYIALRHCPYGSSDHE